MPSPVFALVLTTGTSPPKASTTTSRSASCCSTRSGLTPSLSILFMATTIGTPAARMCWIASSVCGITPSSAATTRMATSVTSAPRARIAVNASWPGVSMNVIRRPLRSTWWARMTWVIPPASPEATLVLRMASSSEVLPWSTCPSTATTGGRGTSVPGAAPERSRSGCRRRPDGGTRPRPRRRRRPRTPPRNRSDRRRVPRCRSRPSG